MPAGLPPQRGPPLKGDTVPPSQSSRERWAWSWIVLPWDLTTYQVGDHRRALPSIQGISDNALRDVAVSHLLVSPQWNEWVDFAANK